MQQGVCVPQYNEAMEPPRVFGGHHATDLYSVWSMCASVNKPLAQLAYFSSQGH